MRAHVRRGGIPGRGLLGLRDDARRIPRCYTVGAGETLSDAWPLDLQGRYALIVHGPNGFFRGVSQSIPDDAHGGVEVHARADAAAPSLRLEMRCDGTSSAMIAIRDLAYGQPDRTVAVAAKDRVALEWRLTASQGWYDLEITVAERPGFLRRLAGHVESGREGTTDPAGPHTG